MQKVTLIAGLAGVLFLAGCAGGRTEPGGSFFDPLCMPDGSVVYYEYPNKAGQFDEHTASKANCPWNKPRA
ncbi:MAG: hypothetical protein HY057_04830 [Rhodospirillales bacterium]|nr:hypothetical protein [Rhodospirillales bacterium]